MLKRSNRSSGCKNRRSRASLWTHFRIHPPPFFDETRGFGVIPLQPQGGGTDRLHLGPVAAPRTLAGDCGRRERERPTTSGILGENLERQLPGTSRTTVVQSAAANPPLRTGSERATCLCPGGAEQNYPNEHPCPRGSAGKKSRLGVMTIHRSATMEASKTNIIHLYRWNTHDSTPLFRASSNPANWRLPWFRGHPLVMGVTPWEPPGHPCRSSRIPRDRPPGEESDKWLPTPSRRN